jgi:hypothetical protein
MLVSVVRGKKTEKIPSLLFVLCFYFISHFFTPETARINLPGWRLLRGGLPVVSVQKSPCRFLK